MAAALFQNKTFSATESIRGGRWFEHDAFIRVVWRLSDVSGVITYVDVQALAGVVLANDSLINLAIWTAFARYLMKGEGNRKASKRHPDNLEPVKDFWCIWRASAEDKALVEHTEALDFVDDLRSKYTSLDDDTYVRMGCLAALNKRGVRRYNIE